MRKLIIATLLLASCTVISHKPTPAEWPQLKIVEAPHDGMWSVIKHCYPYTPLWAKVLLGFNVACAEINFASMTCTIHAAPGDTENRQHELDHCAGMDHVGGSTLEDAWSRWKAWVTQGGATYFYIRHDGKVVGVTR